MIRVGIIGADGRMGRHLIEQVVSNPQVTLTAAITVDNSPCIGLDAGALIHHEPLGVLLSSDLGAVLSNVDVVIDFTNPKATIAHLALLAASSIPVVVGTTGFSTEEKQEVYKTSHLTPVLFSPNMSMGVNLVYKLLEQAAKIMGDTADIEIIEMHHRHKVDAPSGTALKMGEVIAKALDRDLEECAVYGRHGAEGPRNQKTIGFSTLRGGDVVGDHTVIFADIGERLEITHKASDRRTFAKGAVHGAIWLSSQKAGLYSMEDSIKI